jgi:molecular chaperone GrpE
MTPDENSTFHEDSPQGSDADTLAADVHAANQAVYAGDVQRLNEEVKQANDRALRAQAELENFRRRMRREMEEERRHAALPLISDLLAVVDNLDRALAAEKVEAANGLLEGVRMVQTQFLSVLERHHCRRIGEVGEPFDPNQHQAIAPEPSDQIEPGHVTRVAQFGYRLHDRVVRPAQVLVCSGPQKSAANTPAKADPQATQASKKPAESPPESSPPPPETSR